MANKLDSGIQVLCASILGTTESKGISKVDVAEVNAEIQKLASNPNPENRYEIAQITGYAVQSIMETTEDFLSRIAEVKTTAVGEKAQFKITKSGIRAFIQAKGSTTPRSKVVNKYVTLDTEEVAARPYINYLELASGKFDFANMITLAANEMTNAKLEKIDAVLRAGAASFITGAYGSGAGIVKATFDPILQNFQRLGKASIVGDIYVISKFNGIAGFNGTNAPSDKIQDEIMANGHIGNYLGAGVVKFSNPLKMGTFTPVINQKWLYILAGLESPLKVVNEGDVVSLDQTNIDDNSYEVSMRQNFGAGVILGDIPTIGAYQDTTI